MKPDVDECGGESDTGSESDADSSRCSNDTDILLSHECNNDIAGLQQTGTDNRQLNSETSSTVKRFSL